MTTQLETVREFRRDQIVAMGRKLVAEQGLGGLTIGALEDRLPFSRGVITHHFANKDDIVEAVLASALAEIELAMHVELGKPGGLEAQLRTVFDTAINGFLTHREAGWILLSFWGRIPADRHIRKANAQLYARYRRQAASLARAAQAEVAPDAVATLMVGIVIGIAAQAYFEEGATDTPAAIDAAVTAVLALLRRRPR